MKSIDDFASVYFLRDMLFSVNFFKMMQSSRQLATVQNACSPGKMSLRKKYLAIASSFMPTCLVYLDIWKNLSFHPAQTVEEMGLDAILDLNVLCF